MSGFNRITKEKYLEIKEDAKREAESITEQEDKANLVEERKKDFTSEDERIVFIGNLYFPDDDEFLKDYNMYNRNIKLMADNYNIDTYIVRCKVLEMAMFKETKTQSSTVYQPSIEINNEEITNDTIENDNDEEETNEYKFEDSIEPKTSFDELVAKIEEKAISKEDIKEKEEETISDFDDMTDSFLDESSAKVNEISERNVEIETLQKSLIESIRVAKVNVSRKSEELNSEREDLEKERKEFEDYKRIEMESLSNERMRLHKEEERLLALKNKIMDTIKTFEEAKSSLASVFGNDD